MWYGSPAAIATTLQSITFLMLSSHTSSIPVMVYGRRYKRKGKFYVPIWPSLKSNIKWWIGEIVKFVWKFTNTTTTGRWCHIKCLRHHLRFVTLVRFLCLFIRGVKSTRLEENHRCRNRYLQVKDSRWSPCE